MFICAANLVKVFSVFFSFQVNYALSPSPSNYTLLFFLESELWRTLLLTEMELKNIFMEDLWYVADYIWIADSKLVLDLSPSKIIDKRDSS